MGDIYKKDLSGIIKERHRVDCRGVGQAKKNKKVE
jgi:hypothetical protein